MHPQLTAIADELAATTDRSRALVTGISESRFHARPEPTAWSPAECLAHLNTSSVRFLPLIDGAIAEGRAEEVHAGRRYHRDFKGWLLCLAVEPPARGRFKTTTPFIPTSTGSREEVFTEFIRLQEEVVRRLEAASGLDLNHVRITSPFNAQLSYNLYSGFRVIPCHQRRHLWQAERALARTTG